MIAARLDSARLALSVTLGAAALFCIGHASQAADAPRMDHAVVASEVARIMDREQAAMAALGADRIKAIARDRAEAKARPEAAAVASAKPAVAKRPVAIASRSPAADTVIVASTPSAAPARLDFAALDSLPPASGDAQFQCLAAAIYFESRGEPLAGQIGVAEVVLNRVDSRSYPNTICGVTTQGVGSGRGCQFSYACDGHPDVMTSAGPRQRAEKLARLMIDGRARTVTSGATHFHSTAVRPDWSRKFARTAAIGRHMFYRQPTQLASN